MIQFAPHIKSILHISGWVLLAVALAVVCVQLGTNPGYFSHDELQWGEHAFRSWAEMPWQSFTNFDAFQYRPLTFNLWLLLSRVFYPHPTLMHVAWLALGACNALLIQRFMLAAGARVSASIAASMLFFVSPYAVYVHGWVATLADLLWVGCSLALALITVKLPPPWLRWRLFALAAVLTSVALLVKEAAVVIPAVVAVAWVGTRQTRTAWAFGGSLLAVTVYLVVRLDAILFDTPENTGYGWSVELAPLRIVQYYAFPFIPSAFEVHTLQFQRLNTVAAAVLALGCTAVAVSRLRSLLVLALGSAACLAPVLILESAANQYGYGLSAFAVVYLGLCSRFATTRGKVALVLLALLSTWHGIRIAAEMHRTGELQQRFSSTLVDYAMHSGEGPILLFASRPQDQWLYTRLTHQVPSWRGQELGEVRMVHRAADANAVIQRDGTVEGSMDLRGDEPTP